MNARLLFSTLALSATLVASADITGLTDLTDDLDNRAAISGNDLINDKATNGKAAFNISGADQAAINNDPGANRLGGGGGGNSENPLWVTYEFKTNTVVNAYRIWNQGPRGGYSQAERSPKDFYLEGSLGGSTWVTLDSRTNQQKWSTGEPRVFEFDNAVAYKFYRMTFTANVGGADAYIMIQELEYFSRPELAHFLRIEGQPSNYGTPSPEYGDMETTEGQVFEASVDSQVEIASGQVAGCVGWETSVRDTEDSSVWNVLNTGKGNAFSFTHPGGAVKLTWRFAISNLITTAVHGGGTASGGGWYPQDESVTLKATADDGYDFIRWIGDADGVEDPTAAEITVTADAPRTLTAFFVPKDGAKVLYVSPEGNDTNEGFSLTDAKATVGAAVSYLGQTYMEGTIFVAPGVYEQTQEFVLANPIEVVGLTGRPQDVVLRNTSGGSRVLTVSNRNAVVTGVVIENGRCNNDYGGNVKLSGDGGTISNCVIRSGYGADVRGANVVLSSPNALVTHCVISNGAILAKNEANGTAIFVTGNGGRISNCLITKNATADNARQQTPNNKTVSVVALNGPAVMDNCTIVDNCHTGLVSAVFAKSDMAVRVYNCVIARNTTPKGTVVAAVSGGKDKFFNCVTDGETAINGTCKIGTVDEMFASVTDGRWLPLPDGLLINAGTTSGLAVPSTDLRGNPRIRGDAIDVGCYEDAVVGFVIRIR